MRVNHTVETYQLWLDTEDRLIQQGVEEDGLLFLEDIFSAIFEEIQFQEDLTKGKQTDSTSYRWRQTEKFMEYVAVTQEEEKDADHRYYGKKLEDNFYQAAVEVYGEANVFESSPQDDILCSTDFHIYGYPIDVTFGKKYGEKITRDFYLCKEGDLKCYCSILSNNGKRELPRPVLSMKFLGDIENKIKMRNLIKTHMTKILLEFNRLCHIMQLI